MKDRKQRFLLTTNVVTVTVALLFFQTLASQLSAYIAQSVDCSEIDPYGVFVCISVHHVIQMIIALAAIAFFKKKSGMKFGLNPRFSKNAIRYTVFVTLIIAVVVFIAYVILIRTGTEFLYNYPLNKKNIIGSLSFQLLLSGPSEEILFRALPLTILLYFWNKDKNRNPIIPILLTSALFSAAHINWSISPLQINFSNWMQLIYSFILGVVYGVTYIKFRSIIYPVILHSMSNIFMVGGGYLFVFLLS